MYASAKQCEKAIMLLSAILLGAAILGCGTHRVKETEAGEAVAPDAAEHRRSLVEAWAASLEQEPATAAMVERVELCPESPEGSVAANIYLELSSTVAKAAADDPGAAAVEKAAKELAAGLYAACECPDICMAEVDLYLGDRHVGTASYGKPPCGPEARTADAYQPAGPARGDGIRGRDRHNTTEQEETDS
jgi:hypothetical protein